MQIWHLDPTSPASFIYLEPLYYCQMAPLWIQWNTAETFGAWCLSFIKYIYLFFNWRIIALQNFVVFCQTSTWVSLPFERPSYLPPHPTPLGWCPLKSSSLEFRRLHTINFLISSFSFKWTHLLGILQVELAIAMTCRNFIESAFKMFFAQ